MNMGIVLPSIFVAQPAMYLNISEDKGTSAAPATATGFPLSKIQVELILQHVGQLNHQFSK